MFVFDCHLDLSMNAMEWNRDLTRPIEEIRRREKGLTDRKDRERGVVCFPEMRRGKVGICVATQIARYVKETNRLYGVLNKRLADREFVAGAYSIADMAAYPWIVPHEAQSQNLDDFPHLKRWFDAIKIRPATVRAYERGAAISANPTVNEDSRKILFGQSAQSVGGN